MFGRMKHILWRGCISLFMIGSLGASNVFAQGNFGYVTNGYGYGVYRINLSNGAVTYLAGTNNYAGNATLNQRGTKLWVTTGSQFVVLNSGTGATLYTSPYSNSSYSRPVFSPDGARAYVALNNYPASIVVRDTLSYARVDSFSFATISGWYSDPVLSPDGTALYILDNSYYLNEIDPYSGAILGRTYLSQYYYRLVLHPDGTSLYAVGSYDIAVFDIGTHTISKHLNSLENPIDVIFNRDGSKLYESSSSYSYLRVFDLGGGTSTDYVITSYGGRLALGPSDSLLYIGLQNLYNGDNIGVYNTRTNTVTTTLSIPYYPNFIVMPLPPDNISPAAVSDLQVNALAYNKARLIFTSTGDDGTSGRAAFYAVRYDTVPVTEGNFSQATPYTGAHSPKSSGTPDTIDVTGLRGGTTYYFGIKAGDELLNLSPLAAVSTPLPPPPHISVAPESFTGSMGDNDSLSFSFTIQNPGGSALEYSIGVADVSVDETAVGTNSVPGRIDPEGVSQRELLPRAAEAGAFFEGGACLQHGAAAAFPSAPVPSPAAVNAAGPKVLLLHSDDATSVNDVKTKLVNLGLFSGVDDFDLRYQTPTLEYLHGYDGVLMWINYYLSDETGIGNLLADYVDQGGKLVLAMFAMAENSSHPNPQIGGRFNTQDYWVVEPGLISYNHDNLVLGTVDKPNHPIMKGVKTFIGNHSYRVQGATLGAGGQRIASWSDGSVLVAERSVKGRKRVDLNFYPISSDIGPGELWQSSSDGAKIMGNALLYISRAGGGEFAVSFSSPAGSVEPGEQLEIQAKITTVNMMAAQYTMNLALASNDPDSSVIFIPVHLTVRDLTPPFIALRFFQNEELTQYLDIISVARETLYAPTCAVALGNDTSRPPLILLDSANFVRSASYKMHGSGTLTVIFDADDSVGNHATVTRQLNAQQVSPASERTIGSVDEMASMTIPDHTFDGELFLTCVADEPDRTHSQMELLGRSYIFGPSSARPGKSPSLTLRFPQGTGAEQAAHLAICALGADGSWQPLPTSVDVQRRELHAPVDRLGTFQIVYDPAFQTEPFTAVPERYALGQNFPNPFNPATEIHFDVAERSHVTIRIYNVVGQEVARVADATMDPGSYVTRWDGTDGHGLAAGSGVYFCRMDAGTFSQIRKMILLK